MADPQQSSSPPDEGAFSPSFLRLLDQRSDPMATRTSLQEGPWQIHPTADQKWGCWAEGEAEPYAILDHRYLALLFCAALPIASGPGHFAIERHGESWIVLQNGIPVGSLKWGNDELITTVDRFHGHLCRPASFAYLMEAAGGGILDRTGRILSQRVLEAHPGGGRCLWGARF